ncbi:MAG TPA: translation elongation factor EF-1 subunit alpha [Candidatus Thermoplasmatota archaeon]|nr:translation elongation factor EF-1 subunit alpha [Candidatus Thermoplasmatota archaeon]
MATKPHMNIVFIGHVDHGKSTTVGRLLLDTGTIPQYVLDQLKKEAEEKGKGGFEFAYVMDNLKEERERGVTIDIAHKKFETNKTYFTIIDAPGHRDFVKNMITGTSQADCAVIVVGASEGIQEQTREHVYLAKVLGVQQIIVAVNKMDTQNYDQKKFEAIKADAEKLLKTVGFKPEQVLGYIPISAYHGDNVAKKSDKLGWTKQTLVETLDAIKEPAKATDKPLRVPVQDVYTITGIGTVPVGRVETGVLKPGDKVIFNPSNKAGEVKDIEMHHEKIPQAGPGDNIGFNVRGVGKDDVRRGDVCGPQSNPPKVAKSFKAQVVVLKHPSAISVGYTPVFHCHTAQVACTFEALLEKKDPKTGATTEQNPQFLKTGDIGVVKIRPTRPLALETFKDIPQLARFAIRDMGTTVAAGICLEIES